MAKNGSEMVNFQRLDNFVEKEFLKKHFATKIVRSRAFNMIPNKLFWGAFKKKSEQKWCWHKNLPIFPQNLGSII